MGIAGISASSARQFFLGDCELVRLAGLDYEIAPEPERGSLDASDGAPLAVPSLVNKMN